MCACERGLSHRLRRPTKSLNFRNACLMTPTFGSRIVAVRMRNGVKMASKDRFKLDLKCPACGRTGVAEVWEEDGYTYAFGDASTHVEALPPGFKEVAGPPPRRMDIHCVDHSVSAIS